MYHLYACSIKVNNTTVAVNIDVLVFLEYFMETKKYSSQSNNDNNNTTIIVIIQNFHNNTYKYVIPH